MYFFRREKIQCRYQFSLRDAVDITLLQRALTAALASAPYYTQRLVQEKREMWLEPNTEPCLVYPGSTMRNIPEQTNGYLFCVSCEGDTVYFDWHHFLLDGHGVSPLLTSILEQYCNLRYGTAFAVPQIVCDPPYDMEAMLAEYPPVEYGSDVIQRDVVQTYEGALRRTRVCLSKQSLVEKALANNAKPVSALMGLLCMAMREYLGKEKIQYSYSSDTRDVAGVPNALYNCVCSFGHTVQLQAQTRLADFVADVDADIRRDLQPQSKRRRMADQMGWVYKVNQQKAPLRIKQRVFQMGEYIGGTISDFWLSYLGNPLMPATPELAQYTTDFGVWVPPDGAVAKLDVLGCYRRFIEQHIGKNGQQDNDSQQHQTNHCALVSYQTEPNICSAAVATRARHGNVVQLFLFFCSKGFHVGLLPPPLLGILCLDARVNKCIDQIDDQHDERKEHRQQKNTGQYAGRVLRLDGQHDQ